MIALAVTANLVVIAMPQRTPAKLAETIAARRLITNYQKSAGFDKTEPDLLTEALSKDEISYTNPKGAFNEC